MAQSPGLSPSFPPPKKEIDNYKQSIIYEFHGSGNSEICTIHQQ